MTRPHNFRHSDVKRALRAATAAGVRNPRIEVHLATGGHLVIGSGEVEAPPKKSKNSRADFAEGGRTAMHGRGSRTATAPEDAAAPQASGRTGHRTGSDTQKRAKGGEVRAVGGEARKARPGECGT